ncbi:hypothetical protein N8766_03130 [bacterium]|jgi:hypothetical protein|nr:hypothetical protein [bacterium]MDB4746032.1 hypothetical protein [Verrucomicrobiota bacterium]MDB4798656.1 hypothetical protein [Verrucomicrobiota bacterium]
MSHQISSKNIIVGFMLGVIATASLGAALKHKNEIGRFQIAAGNTDAYVVDTVTGQVWSKRHNVLKSAAAFRLPKADAN